MEQLGLAYVLRVGGGHSMFTSVEGMLSHIRILRADRPNITFTFITSVSYDCLDYEGCLRTFAEWPP